jgi:hypothetical protein
VLGLWDETTPPQLLSVEEFERGGAYGLRLLFDCGAVDAARWQDRQDRLGRFFGPGLQASLSQPASGRIGLELIGTPTPAASIAADAAPSANAPS